MKKVFILSAAFIFSASVLGQSPAIQWKKCFGGSSHDWINAICHAPDGGYVAAGTTWSSDVDSGGNVAGMWILKIDSMGNLQWQRFLGALGDAKCINQTIDGGYILCGSNNGDCLILKLDSQGFIQWQKLYGGTHAEFGYSVEQTVDTGYIVAAGTYSNDGDVIGYHGTCIFEDCWILKLDAAGNIQWQKCLGGTDSDEGSFVSTTSDGGYIISVSTLSSNGDVVGNNGGYDAWIIKLNASGNIQWKKCFGGSNNDFASSVKQSPDGGYILAGNSQSNDGQVSGNHDTTGMHADAWIVKLSSSGIIQWQKCYGGSDDDWACTIQENFNGGYVFLGGTQSNDYDVSGHYGSNDFWVVGTDYNGNLLWQKCLGGSGAEYTGPNALLQSADGGSIIAGQTFSFDGDASDNHTSDGMTDALIIKLSFYDVGIKEFNSYSFVNVFPNPVTNELQIQNAGLKIKEIEIYDVLGEKVISKREPVMDVSQLDAGIYFVKVLTDKGIIARKFVKQ